VLAFAYALIAAKDPNTTAQTVPDRVKTDIPPLLERRVEI
jgi:hypothetical protein